MDMAWGRHPSGVGGLPSTILMHDALAWETCNVAVGGFKCEKRGRPVELAETDGWPKMWRQMVEREERKMEVVRVLISERGNMGWWWWRCTRVRR